MLQLISENKFEELQQALKNSGTFQIHQFLAEVMNNNEVKIDGESFDARKYQEEFIEGLAIYSALQTADFNKTQLRKYSSILVELAFKMSEFMQLMAKTAMDNGVYLSDLEDLYKVNPAIREKLQDFIEILKSNEQEGKAIANIAAAKAKVSNSIGNLLEKYEIGEDMLQFAQACENAGQPEMAVKIYQGILSDFECESVKLSSGLFPEISQADDRPESEIKIYEKAKDNFERLTGQIINGPKRVHINDGGAYEATERKGFLGKLRNLFKKTRSNKSRTGQSWKPRPGK